MSQVPQESYIVFDKDYNQAEALRLGEFYQVKATSPNQAKHQVLDLIVPEFVAISKLEMLEKYIYPELVAIKKEGVK